MLGVAKRLIVDENIKRTACDKCNTEESLNVKVYSKFFMLKFLPFAFSREIYVSCTSCKRFETNLAIFPKRVKDRIEAVTDDAKHPWYLYIGYFVIAIAMLLVLMLKK